MLSLYFELVAHWPKLAWVCVAEAAKKSAKVLHGSMVEVSESWAVEAVWDGNFEEGAFDASDLFYGSGIRKRGNDLIFISSATGVDRLWYVEYDSQTYVSNTLPGILNISGLSLRDDYLKYAEDIMTIETKGIYNYVGSIPSSGPNIGVVYYQNILWNYKGLKMIDKPDNTPDFSDYNDYECYLKNTAEALGANARSSCRKHQIDMLVGISSGYDSVATAVISRYAGCNKSASIINSTSFWRGSDSGQYVAEKLNMECQLVVQNRKKYKQEISTWAAAGHAGGRNFTVFDYPKPLCLFFNGSYGDVIWDLHSSVLKEPNGNNSVMACEFRLIDGFFVTVVPFWGIRKGQEIQRIGFSDAMEPWTLGRKYDRPIPRRLGEEAGVPRGLFGIKKKDTASNTPFWWPSTKEADESFREYLDLLEITPPHKFVIRFLSFFSLIVSLVNNNLLFFIENDKKWKPWLKSPVRHLFFSWANHSLRDKYYR